MNYRGHLWESLQQGSHCVGQNGYIASSLMSRTEPRTFRLISITYHVLSDVKQKTRRTFFSSRLLIVSFQNERSPAQLQLV